VRELEKGETMSEEPDKGVTPEPETLVVEEAVEEKYDEAGYKALVAKLRENEKQAKKDATKLAKMEEAEQKRADAEKSELQKSQEAAAKLAQENKDLVRKIMRRDVAAKTKLPDVFVDRLNGETPEELEADALAILAAMPNKVPPKTDATNPSAANVGETDDERRKRLGL